MTEQYEFKMIQIPQTFHLQKDTGKEIAAYLEQLARDNSAGGWEFYRIDQVGVQVAPGCGGVMMGQKVTMSYYNVVTFRRLKPTTTPA